MKKKLFVLLGDVMFSRKIKDREQFQEKLIKTCAKVLFSKQRYLNTHRPLTPGSRAVRPPVRNLSFMCLINSGSTERPSL